MYDDLADNIWGGLYESDGLLLHHEELVLYNPRNRKHLEEMPHFFEECARVSVEEPLGLGFGLFEVPGAHSKFGPLVSNYHRWQRKIKKMLDPRNLMESALYV